MWITEITSKYRCKLIIRAYKNWIKKEDSVLDVGCGDGIISIRLVRHFKIKLTGCDTLSYLTKEIPFVKMESKTKLPFPKKSFEIVIFNDVLHHMRKVNQIRIIKEALRVSAKVLIFEDKPTFTGKMADILANILHNIKMETPLTFRDQTAWEKVFKKLAAKYETVVLPKPFWYPFSHIAFFLKSQPKTSPV